MSYIKVHNPEPVDVKTVFKGQLYEIGAGKTESFPTNVAERFVEVYGFLVIANSEEKKVEEKVEEVTEEVVEKPKKAKK